ncbi:MAG: universal stress protein [Lutimonas sp.]
MNSKRKILVLIDLKADSSKILKFAVEFAEIIDADLNLLHLKRPGEVIIAENQLSAFRTFSDEHKKIKAKAKTFINKVPNNENKKIEFKFAIGHPKEVIKNYLDKNKVDVLVIGKKKSKRVEFIGDGFTDVVLRNFNGPLLIVNPINDYPLLTELDLGILNNYNLLSNFKYAKNLLNCTKQPIKAFNFVLDSKKTNPKQEFKEEVVEYFFENKNDDIAINLSNYLSKSKVNLLYIDREINVQSSNNYKTFDIKAIIANTNVSLLLSEQNTHILSKK